ncbi:hypothetical protein, partial [Tannerella forsythia]
MLYQLSYFRTIFFTHLQSADVAFPLPRLEPFIFWGKVVLYQLSYFRTIFFTHLQSADVAFPLPRLEPFIFPGQGGALPTELLPHYISLRICSLPMSLFPCQGWNLLSFRGKVVLYQLSYFR